MARKRALALASIGVALLGLAVAGAAGAAPAAGRYQGSLCVAAAATAPDCGPARVDLVGTGQATVRVSDIAYWLVLHSSQADVVVKHGAMQIDEFTAEYEWTGPASDRTLRFVDADKRVHYEVRLGRRQGAPR